MTRSIPRRRGGHQGAILIIDDGKIAAPGRTRDPDGVDAALELAGTPTLLDPLRATRVHGTVWFPAGASNGWIVKESYPIGYLSSGVRLTAYGGESSDLPRQAHDDRENHREIGKQVVVL